ncbi:high affinity immunoglobulin epsilon receptor subunit gamma [Pterocles gutturalis]
MGPRLLLATVLLLLRTPPTEALMEPELCYVLDAVLFLYGVVLTGLYCRLKEQKEEAIYAGLSGEGHEMYETLQIKNS